MDLRKVAVALRSGHTAKNFIQIRPWITVISHTTCFKVLDLWYLLDCTPKLLHKETKNSTYSITHNWDQIDQGTRSCQLWLTTQLKIIIQSHKQIISICSLKKQSWRAKESLTSVHEYAEETAPPAHAEYQLSRAIFHIWLARKTPIMAILIPYQNKILRKTSVKYKSSVPE